MGTAIIRAAGMNVGIVLRLSKYAQGFSAIVGPVKVAVCSRNEAIDEGEF
jgi:hypothetical protein